jgi:hypothetical protein
MISLAQLWLPVLLSAVAIFIVSSLVHMVFKWHNSDYKGLANEDAVRATMRAGNPVDGMYVIPYCKDHKELNNPEMVKKFEEGPVGMLFLRPAHKPSMGAPLMQWFVLCLVVSGITAYLASKSVPLGASPLAVCRFVGSVVFVAFATGSISNGIWIGEPWRSVAKALLDAFLYGLAAALVFACLWPK